MKLLEGWYFKLSILGILGTMLSGLVYITYAYAHIQSVSEENQSDVMELKHQVTKLNDIQTDVAVIKSQVIEINKKLDELQ